MARSSAPVRASAPGGMADIYRSLIAYEGRLLRIVEDVLAAAAQGADILVLTTWVDHLTALTEQLRAHGKTVTVLSGK